MSQSADVIIVGAGIMGLCTAYHLGKRSDLSIVVLDKGLGPGEGSTGASSAVCRHLYTHDEMIELARDGIQAYRNWAAFLEMDEKPLAEFQQVGALWLGNREHNWEPRHIERLARFEIASTILNDDQIRARFPAINPCGLAPDFVTGEDHDCVGGATHLLEEDAGYMDPQGALQDLVQVLKRRGVEVRFRSEVCQILRANGRVNGVECADGTRVNAKWVVNANGPWCYRLLGQLELIVGHLHPPVSKWSTWSAPPRLLANYPSAWTWLVVSTFVPKTEGSKSSSVPRWRKTKKKW